ncbi:MAG: DUF460 domain-containing protein [Candidatus Micrarchaeia archaeon]
MKLIVGIDPGATVGVAALDLSGRLVALASGRGWGKEEIVERIRAVGSPAIFACDVRSPPDLLLRLAGSFNAHLYAPEKDLREEEKRELAGGTPCANEHEMDALAAAKKAFHSVENKLRQVAKALTEEGLEAEEEFAKSLVLAGTSLSNVLALLKARRLAVMVRAGEATPEKKRSVEEEVERLAAELEAALQANAELRKRTERLAAQLASAREEAERARSGMTERLRREAELLKREAEIRRLRRTIAGLRRKEFLKRLGKKKTAPDLEKIISEYRRD